MSEHDESPSEWVITRVTGDFPDIIASLRKSVQERDYAWEDLAKFLPIAVDDLARSKRLGESFSFYRAQQEFPQIVSSIADDIKEEVFTEQRLIYFIARFGEVFNQITKQGSQGEEIMESKDQITEEVIPGLYDQIDGRRLKGQEAAFQEWAAKNFDEKKWLKELGIQIDPDLLQIQ